MIVSYTKVQPMIEKATTIETKGGHGAFGERECWDVEVFDRFEFASLIIEDILGTIKAEGADAPPDEYRTLMRLSHKIKHEYGV